MSTAANGALTKDLPETAISEKKNRYRILLNYYS